MEWKAISDCFPLEANLGFCGIQSVASEGSGRQQSWSSAKRLHLQLVTCRKHCAFSTRDKLRDTVLFDQQGWFTHLQVLTTERIKSSYDLL